MFLHLAYLAVLRVFGSLARSDCAKDAEILLLRQGDRAFGSRALTCGDDG